MKKKLLISLVFINLLIANDKLYLKGHITDEIDIYSSKINVNFNITTKIKSLDKLENKENYLKNIINKYNNCYLGKSNAIPVYRYINNSKKFLHYNINFNVSCKNIDKEKFYNMIKKINKKAYKFYIYQIVPKLTFKEKAKILKAKIQENINKIKKEINKIEATTNKTCIIKRLNVDYYFINNENYKRYPLFPLLRAEKISLPRSIVSRKTTKEKGKGKININYEYECF